MSDNQQNIVAIPKSRVTYVIFALLLGGLGIHNFYAGYTGKAVAQLLISIFSAGFLGLIVYIWAVIEAISVTKDANGVDFR